jgi:hypothetical protein
VGSAVSVVSRQTGPATKVAGTSTAAHEIAPAVFTQDTLTVLGVVAESYKK